MPINYQEGKIYKIYNTINDDMYVGSTTLKLCERMRDHRKCMNVKAKQRSLIYKAFREHGVEHFYIELVEKCPCNDKDELRKKEGEWIRGLNPSLNIRIAGRTPIDYYSDNKESIKEHVKQYKENNKEAIKEQKKHYYEDNKEHITQRTKIYYENNKETMVLRKVECECGCILTRGGLSKHRQSKKHIELMKDKLN